MRRLRRQERRRRSGVRDQADDRAVARGGVVELVGQRQAAGALDVLHHNPGIARNVLAEMRRHETARKIVAGPRRKADAQLNLLAAIEIGHSVLRLRAADRRDHEAE